MAFELAWGTRTVMLMVPVWAESGFRERAPGRMPLADRRGALGG